MTQHVELPAGFGLLAYRSQFASHGFELAPAGFEFTPDRFKVTSDGFELTQGRFEPPPGGFELASTGLAVLPSRISGRQGGFELGSGPVEVTTHAVGLVTKRRRFVAGTVEFLTQAVTFPDACARAPRDASAFLSGRLERPDAARARPRASASTRASAAAIRSAPARARRASARSSSSLTRPRARRRLLGLRRGTSRISVERRSLGPHGRDFRPDAVVHSVRTASTLATTAARLQFGGAAGRAPTSPQSAWSSAASLGLQHPEAGYESRLSPNEADSSGISGIIGVPDREVKVSSRKFNLTAVDATAKSRTIKIPHDEEPFGAT